MKTLHPSVLTVAVVSVIAVAFASFLEIGAAVCASATIFAGYGLFWTVILLPFLLRRPSVVKSGFYALLILSLVILYFIPWNSRKPFLRDLEKVRIGMTMPEVETIMDGYMKGISVSAFNHVQGDVFGICIGIFNWAYAVRGFQLGVLNHVKSNPKGLRWLPIFNTSFGS